MWIMIAGPYGSGALSHNEREKNLLQLNLTALAVFRKGHIPVVGVNNALPLIGVAGEDSFETIMMPLSMALIERCDACLRVGGASAGADKEVQAFLQSRKPVFYSITEVPDNSHALAD